jgi:hypothetical protein
LTSTDLHGCWLAGSTIIGGGVKRYLTTGVIGREMKGCSIGFGYICAAGIGT